MSLVGWFFFAWSLATKVSVLMFFGGVGLFLFLFLFFLVFFICLVFSLPPSRSAFFLFLGAGPGSFSVLRPLKLRSPDFTIFPEAPCMSTLSRSLSPLLLPGSASAPALSASLLSLSLSLSLFLSCMQQHL